jgi:hypothetical protein
VKAYQKQLLALLLQSAWELEEIDSPAEWWVAELWRLKSTGPNWGSSVWITFLVDPMHEGPGKGNVYEVAATVERPVDRLLADDEIATLRLSGSRFDDAVREFVRLINEDRRQRGERLCP